MSIVAKGCSPKIANNVFNNPLWVAVLSTGGSPSITGNVVQNVGTEGISVGGSSIVTNNLFNITSGDATAIVAHENAYVSNNKILSFYNGITADGQATIKGNVIVNCSNDGVNCVSPNVDIENNYITNNHIGISAGGNIANNAIIANTIGIQIQSFPVAATITNNNIVDNTQNSISILSNANIDASNNWWGTTNLQAINQTIRDFKFDFNLGVVNFTPILNQASSTAPTSADIGQLPTAVPTSQPQQESNSPTNTDQGSQPTASSNPNSLGAISGPTSTVDDPLGHLNLTEIVEILLIAMGVVWVVEILFYFNRRSQKKVVKKVKKRKSAKPRAVNQ